MQQVVVLPELTLPAKLTLNPEHVMNDDEYFDFCAANPDVRFERNEQGEILIVPPAAPESDFQSADAAAQLRNWAKRDGRGKSFGSSAGFILATGAVLSPDAAWISNARLAQVSKEQLRKFPHLTPEFVIEVRSPSDRLAAREKMEMWIRGGVELAWLIDGDNRTIYIYRAAGESEARPEIAKLAGEGPIEGFELDLTDTWAGL